MSYKKFRLFGCFAFLILCVVLLNCASRRFIDQPIKKDVNKEKDGIIYLDDEDNPSQQKNANATSQVVKVEYGKASYYSDDFQGKPTASGELYDRDQLTAAHRTLPFGTFCRVTNMANRKSVIVRINDRGPFVRGRIIDLSYHAMQLLDGIRAGEFNVMVEVLR